MSLIKTITLYLAGPASSIFVFVMNFLFTKGGVANAFELIALTLMASYAMSVYPPILMASIGAASCVWLITVKLKKYKLIKAPAALMLCVGLASSIFCSAWFSIISYLVGDSSSLLDWVFREVAPTGALLGMILGHKSAVIENKFKPLA